jgi:hypothetical protein
MRQGGSFLLYDVLPPDLITYGAEAKSLLEDLQSRNERMFLVTMMVMNTSNTKQKLENDVFAASGVAQKYNCALKRLDWQQEQGLMSSLPLGLNQLEIKRGLTTSSTAIFVPFTTCELFMEGQALYYGLNALSNNMIMADRKQLKNPNGLHCKGRYKNHNIQAVTAFAAQTDGRTKTKKTKGEQKLSTSIQLYHKQLNTERGLIPCRRKITRLTKRIGSTTYKVNVHFSETSKETMSDKIIRLIEREAANQ